MAPKKHIDIALRALARGYIDTRALAEAMIALGRGDDAVGTEEFWTSHGLGREQLGSLLADDARRRHVIGRGATTPYPKGEEGAEVRPTLLRGSPRQNPRRKLRAERDEPAQREAVRSAVRYGRARLLGEGGMGVVYESSDERLGRRVAVKYLQRDLLERPSMQLLLEREARVTSGLEHPSIIPIYDAGDDDDGPFYVMRLVDQPSLQSILEELGEGGAARQAEYPTGKLLRYFVQVCRAVDYAHSRGVVHCDLKPDNILIGAFGEVLVLDWGMAHSDEHGPAQRGGTPGYMAPEQISVGAIDARSDVFALGVILYELYAFGPAYDEEQIKRRLLLPNLLPEPLATRARDRAVPAELEEIRTRAMAIDPAARYHSAGALADALEAFLEGTRERERRTARAEELVATGDGLAENYHELVESRPERVASVQAMRRTIPAWESIDKKKPLWDAEDRVKVTDALAIRTLHAAAAAYEQALDEVPGHREARLGLAKLYRVEMQRAAQRRDELDEVYFGELVRQHDDDAPSTQRNHGALTLACGSGRAPVRIGRLENIDRRLVVPADALAIDAPADRLALPSGSYSITVSRGDATARFSALLRPGADLRLSFDLRLLDELAPEECFVPAGPALLALEAAQDKNDLAEVDVPAFVIADAPVSFGQYLEFLADVYRTDPAAAEEHTPANAEGVPYWEWSGEEFVRAQFGFLGAKLEEVLDWPVFGVSASSALHYAAWHGARTGKPYRLPDEREWEKAARGCDGRLFPWGDHFDASFCKMRDSRRGQPRPEPSGAFPVDVSPYGVRDTAGGIADWVATLRDGGAVDVVSRGGAWCDWEHDCRLSTRRPYGPFERSPRVGFRLARSVDP